MFSQVTQDTVDSMDSDSSAEEGRSASVRSRTQSRYLPIASEMEVWKCAVEAAGLPHISLYEGTKHSMATDAIRRGVPERHLQVFLGHKNVESTRRYARLADNALLEVLRPSSTTWGQAGDKPSENETESRRGVTGGPSRTRTWGDGKK